MDPARNPPARRNAGAGGGVLDPARGPPARRNAGAGDGVAKDGLGGVGGEDVPLVEVVAECVDVVAPGGLEVQGDEGRKSLLPIRDIVVAWL